MRLKIVFLVVCFVLNYPGTICDQDPQGTTQGPQDDPTDLPAVRERPGGDSSANQGVTGGQERSKVIVVCLGGSEEQEMTSLITSLISPRGYDVIVFLYGGNSTIFPPNTEVIEIPLAEGDPLYDNAIGRRVEPEDVSANQVTPRQLMTSRLFSCKQISRQNWTMEQLSRGKILVTPLYLHDLCALTLARRFGLPVVGLLTSRVGSWWVWHHSDLLPPLSTAPVPPKSDLANSLLSRVDNIFNYKTYMSALHRDWLTEAMTYLDLDPTTSLAELYANHLSGIIVTWNEIIDPSLPSTSFVTSAAGSQIDTEALGKDLIVPALKNRSGMLTVNVISSELWIGERAYHILRQTLAQSSYTVILKDSRGMLEGIDKRNQGHNDSKSKVPGAVFVYKESLPMREVLGHPRHRLLISMCEQGNEVTTALAMGSPTLCLPVTADGVMNGEALKRLGLALVIPALEMTSENTHAAIKELTINRSFRARGRLLAEEYIDQPLSPSDRILHAIEKVIRRPRRYLRRHSEMSSMVKHNIDVIALATLAVASMVLAMSCCLYLLVVTLKKHLSAEKHKCE